jgi:predicted ATPase
LGSYKEARLHLERSISLYDPAQQRSHTVLFGFDPRVACLSDLGWALWILGYPDSGLEKAREALFVARELGHPYNIAMAMIWLSWVLQCRREGRASQELADAALELSNEHGFPSWVAMATVMGGAALVEHGEPQRGVELLRRGLAAYRLTRTEAGRIFGLTVLAGAHGKLSSLEKALTLVAEGSAIAERTGERYYEAELHRTKGEALLQFKVQAHELEAEACFLRAIEIARKQSAKSLELRATTSLARLLASQGRREKARAMLAEIYGWFTEGFDTGDLIDARALL